MTEDVYVLAVHLGVEMIWKLAFFFLKLIFYPPSSMVPCYTTTLKGFFFSLSFYQCLPENEFLSVTELLVTKYIHIYGLIFPPTTLLL